MFHGKTTTYLNNPLLIASFSLACAITTGCQQMSTYPGVEVTAKYQRPAAEPVPTIIAECVIYAQDHYLKGETLPLNLPEGVPAAVYDKVFVHLTAAQASASATKPATQWNADGPVMTDATANGGGAGGRPMLFPDEPAIHITEIRTRSFNAQVDMVYPTAYGFNQFVTLTLERSVLESWKVKSERKWVVRNMTAPSPNYVPPPPEEAKKSVASASR